VSRHCVLAALVAVCFAPLARAADLALVLNGNDNTLSTVELPAGVGHAGVATFPAYPGHGCLESGRYYAAVSGADRVVVFDAAGLAPLDTLFTGPGTSPFAVAGDGSGNVFVSLLTTNEVVRYDAGGNETARVTVGRSPEGLLVHLGKLFVADTGFNFSDYSYDPGQVSVLDPATLAPLGTIPVGMNPQWPAAAGSEVHVVCTGNYFSVFGEIHAADAATLAPVDTVLVGGSPGFLTVGGGRGYVTDYFGGIYVYDAGGHTVIHDAASPWAFGGSGYSGSAWDGEGHLYVALYDDDLVAKLRVSDEALVDVYPTGDGPGSVVLRGEQAVSVRAVAFEAAAGDGAVRLRWTVSDGDAVAVFLVDRRDAGATTWVRLGSVPANAATFEDHDPAPGGAVYRLAASLRDGSEEILAERRVAGGPARFAVRVLANPARDRLQLRAVGAAAGPLAVRLVDVSGRTARRLTMEGPEMNVPLGEVPAGIYFVTVEQPGHRATARVTVVR